MSNERFPNWVPNNTMDTRRDTAVLLVGTAKEHGLVVRHHVASTQGGFYITDTLADVLYDEDEDEDTEPVSGNGDDAGTATAEATAEATTKTSGKQAAKTTSQEGE